MAVGFCLVAMASSAGLVAHITNIRVNIPVQRGLPKPSILSGGRARTGFRASIRHAHPFAPLNQEEDTEGNREA
jgi:hypothetical protein